MLICLSLSLIAGLLLSRAAKVFNLPAVTSYLLAGLLLGPFFLGRLGLSGLGFGFGSLAQVEGYGILTQVALGFIAFVIGNEFRLSALKRMGRQAVAVGIAQAVITTALRDQLPQSKFLSGARPGRGSSARPYFLYFSAQKVAFCRNSTQSLTNAVLFCILSIAQLEQFSYCVTDWLLQEK